MFSQEQVNVIVKALDFAVPAYAEEIKQELVNTIRQFDGMYKRLEELGEFKKDEAPEQPNEE